eukprot:15225788-Alexandrium_andersonii.AAC.1
MCIRDSLRPARVLAHSFEELRPRVQRPPPRPLRSNGVRYRSRQLGACRFRAWRDPHLPAHSDSCRIGDGPPLSAFAREPTRCRDPTSAKASMP